MIAPGNWTSREWTFGRTADQFSAVLERLRGTPARAEELVRTLPARALTIRTAGRWSVQEHLGHLSDLHALDDRRLTEFLDRVDVLSAADMSNTATERAQHNGRPIEAILDDLRTTRAILVQRLEALSAEQVQHAALHPRLNQRMTVVDWMFFVAEHDDHHLAHARAAADASGSSANGGVATRR